MESVKSLLICRKMSITNAYSKNLKNLALILRDFFLTSDNTYLGEVGHLVFFSLTKSQLCCMRPKVTLVWCRLGGTRKVLRGILRRWGWMAEKTEGAGKSTAVSDS